MNVLRRELIKAYFEATWHEDSQGLDYASKKLKSFFPSLKELKGFVVTEAGAFIQCEEDMLPPVSFVISAKKIATGQEFEVMIEVDEFCNVENIWMEAQ